MQSIFQRFKAAYDIIVKKHIKVYIEKSLSKTSVLKRKGTLFINITMGSI